MYNFFNNNKHLYLSISDISSSLTGERARANLPIWDRYCLRLPSFYITFILYNLFRLSANAVSLISAVYAIILFSLVYISPEDYIIIMLIFINIWPLLDCVDGNIARSLALKYKIKNPFGELYDAIAGWIVLGGLWITIGYYLTWLYKDNIFLLIGTFSTISALIARLINLKLKLAENCNNNTLETSTKKFYPKVVVEFGRRNICNANIIDFICYGIITACVYCLFLDKCFNFNVLIIYYPNTF